MEGGREEETWEAPRQPESEELHCHHLHLEGQRPGACLWCHCWLLDLPELKVEQEEAARMAARHHAVPAV